VPWWVHNLGQRTATALDECVDILGGGHVRVTSLAIRNLRMALRRGVVRDFTPPPCDAYWSPDITRAQVLAAERQWAWENGLLDTAVAAFVLERGEAWLRRSIKHSVFSREDGSIVSPHQSVRDKRRYRLLHEEERQVLEGDIR
jgi:hypothetical protein